MYATSRFNGRFRSNSVKASSPPADAPMPTIFSGGRRLPFAGFCGDILDGFKFAGYLNKSVRARNMGFYPQHRPDRAAAFVWVPGTFCGLATHTCGMANLNLDGREYSFSSIDMGWV